MIKFLAALPLMVALLFPGVTQAQKWNVPLIPTIEVAPAPVPVKEDVLEVETVPDLGWYEEIVALTNQLEEQAKVIEQLSKDLKEQSGMKGIRECGCSGKWEDYEDTIEDLQDAIEVLQKASLTPPTGFVPNQTASNVSKEGVTIEMHTFTGGRSCGVCDRWLQTEAPILRAKGHKVEVHQSVVNGSVPRFRVCLPGGKCYEFNGFQNAGTLLGAIEK